MANMAKPAYQGKALSPGNQLSQGRATSLRANQQDLPKNEPSIGRDPQNPSVPPPSQIMSPAQRAAMSQSRGSGSQFPSGTLLKKPGKAPNVG